MILPKKFYLQETTTVAKDLLGKILIRKYGSIVLKSLIVETEAYIGDHDPACHAYYKLTPRNQLMFEEGGITYVYFIYGNYFCFNIVTGNNGEGNAVLIRAVEPLSGESEMIKNRNNKTGENLTNGPGKLCMALNINKNDNGLKVYSQNSDIQIKDTGIKINPREIKSTKRIGISQGEEFLYRFFLKNNKFVTPHKFNRL
ncbi:MAG: DNA-3-methyladenine glycosylase [Ignavibacteria bacterium]|nr:DNA-3-methyladenine glycosylase [Ignavibacteria bacterium]